MPCAAGLVGGSKATGCTIFGKIRRSVPGYLFPYLFRGLDYLSSSRTPTRAFKCRGWRAPSLFPYLFPEFPYLFNISLILISPWCSSVANKSEDERRGKRWDIPKASAIALCAWHVGGTPADAYPETCACKQETKAVVVDETKRTGDWKVNQ